MKTPYKKLPTVAPSKYVVDPSLDSKILMLDLSPEMKEQQNRILAMLKKAKQNHLIEG